MKLKLYCMAFTRLILLVILTAILSGIIVMYMLFYVSQLYIDHYMKFVATTKTQFLTIDQQLSK